MIEYVIERLASNVPEALKALLSANRTLVPMPKSAPFPPKESNVLWVPRRIAEVLAARGLGGPVRALLVRSTAVQKSAYAEPGGRPTTKAHFDSLRVEKIVDPPEAFTIVDDVITRGATLLAAASRLRETYPLAEIDCFALVRTRGLVAEIDKIEDPAVGTIRRNSSGEADRQP